MANKKIITMVAISGILLGIGGLSLHGAMVFAQNNDIEKEMSQNAYNLFTDTNVSEKQTDAMELETGEVTVTEKVEGDTKVTTSSYEWNGMRLNFNVIDGYTVDQAASDMKPEEAASIALNLFREIFQEDIEATSVEIYIYAIGEDDFYQSRDVNARYYNGTFLCSNGSFYNFRINSVTGDINGIFVNRGIKATDKVELNLNKDVDYSQIAENFVNNILDKGTVKKIYGDVDATNPRGVRIYCDTTDGSTIEVDIYRKNLEITGFIVNPVEIDTY